MGISEDTAFLDDELPDPEDATAWWFSTFCNYDSYRVAIAYIRQTILGGAKQFSCNAFCKRTGMTRRRAWQVLDDLVFYGYIKKEKQQGDGRRTWYVVHTGDYETFHIGDLARNSSTRKPEILFTEDNIRVMVEKLILREGPLGGDDNDELGVDPE